MSCAWWVSAFFTQFPYAVNSHPPPPLPGWLHGCNQPAGWALSGSPDARRPLWCPHRGAPEEENAIFATRVQDSAFIPSWYEFAKRNRNPTNMQSCSFSISEVLSIHPTFHLFSLLGFLVKRPLSSWVLSFFPKFVDTPTSIYWWNFERFGVMGTWLSAIFPPVLSVHLTQRISFSSSLGESFVYVNELFFILPGTHPEAHALLRSELIGSRLKSNDLLALIKLVLRQSSVVSELWFRPDSFPAELVLLGLKKDVWSISGGILFSFCRKNNLFCHSRPES